MCVHRLRHRKPLLCGGDEPPRHSHYSSYARFPIQSKEERRDYLKGANQQHSDIYDIIKRKDPEAARGHEGPVNPQLRPASPRLPPGRVGRPARLLDLVPFGISLFNRSTRQLCVPIPFLN